MHLVYYDESGDDGVPGTSPLFVLTAFYCEANRWRENFINFREFRRTLKARYHFPMKVEMHTKHFILNKKPYYNWGISLQDRLQIVGEYCDRIATLDGKVVNIVINKKAIHSRKYKVLDRALTYSIQRIENDMRKTYSSDKFLMITDPGRLPPMRRTSRRLQAINFIPSQFGSSSYRQDIKLLIEDPLEKDSKQSYFIQISDFIARLVYMYKLLEFGGGLSNRTPTEIDKDKLHEWLTRLRPVINLAAHPQDEFGIVTYPK